MKYETNNFQQFGTIRSFRDSIFTGNISIDEADMDQTNLLENIVKFNDKSRPKLEENKNKRGNTFDSVNAGNASENLLN